MPTPAHTSRVYPWPKRAESALSTARLSRAQEVDQLFNKEFFPGRSPRSAPYRQGVRSVLDFHIADIAFPPLPWPEGTAEADAFFAGQNEGWEIVDRRERSQ
jgi:hypothetical protein